MNKNRRYIKKEKRKQKLFRELHTGLCRERRYFLLLLLLLYYYIWEERQQPAAAIGRPYRDGMGLRDPAETRQTNGLPYPSLSFVLDNQVPSRTHTKKKQGGSTRREKTTAP